ncbi:DUF7668 domain-containing protein [Solirubrobacter deserti]|uniref:DUF7668 domain-containing protein n=1 Tax=Solirubrobacter deserti TaxID=2282478 RepID=A0ABT4RQW8_9ACTN|nr:hypothetical protein [Solirubrobacter deserti]MDA0140855.1 hypothetical protein [Solirubrobacter deserti]
MGDHLIVQHAAVRACPGYDRHEAPSMLMDGTSLATDTEHGRAVAAQLTRRHDTLEDAIEAGNFALAQAGVPKAIRRQARAACEDYFYNRLELQPDLALTPLQNIPPGLEPMPEPMIKVLEDLVELIVDGDYEEVRELSGDTLEIEDIRRRVDDDCPAAYVMPPREVYRVEALTVIDEPDQEGWTFFLELWAEDGPAQLHIEGELQESSGRYEVTLRDILP